ncbi:MAG: RnfABCDGE type electron transport complex subunit G [Deltaproteobacteria bacterium]|nr:RnfABCDGE type electron transport complex subunit G [Candidatus Zymogenaceae bacterium]
MKETARLILVLVLICLVAALALSQVYSFTKVPIENALREERLRAIRTVLPSYDNEPDRDVVSVITGTDEEGTEIITDYYIGRSGEDIIGVAFVASSSAGYSGDIGLMVGVDPDGIITGVEVISHAETPGLGSKITESWFLALFPGRDLENTRWAVKKDGGDIDQITGATISPRAVVEAVYEGLEVFSAHREDILAQAEHEEYNLDEASGEVPDNMSGEMK